MDLSNFLPTTETEIKKLEELLHGQSALAALPSALPEAILIAIARDMRMLENQDGNDNLTENYLAGPIRLIQKLNSNETRTRKPNLNQNAIIQSLHVYQWAIEREITRRITGTSQKNDEVNLLESMKRIALPN